MDNLLQIFRFAYYVLPGSIIIFSFWLLTVTCNCTNFNNIFIPLPQITGIDVYCFLCFSYCIGTGVWGVSLLEIKRFLIEAINFFLPRRYAITKRPEMLRHEIRVSYLKKMLETDWLNNHCCAKIKTIFPDYFNNEQSFDSIDIEKIDYKLFEMMMHYVLFFDTGDIKTRLVWQRDTSILLYSMMIAFSSLSISLFVKLFDCVLFSHADSLCLLLSAFPLVLIIIFTFQIHYKKRNELIVRDVLYGFIFSQK